MLTSNAMGVFADHFDAYITTHNHYVHAYSHSNCVIVLHACYYNDSGRIGDVRFRYIELNHLSYPLYLYHFSIHFTYDKVFHISLICIYHTLYIQ